jgi:hypothetical protein
VARRAGVEVADKPLVIRAFIKPAVVVERTELNKNLVDIVIAMTGRDERYACLEIVGRGLTVTLANSEYSARHGAE